MAFETATLRFVQAHPADAARVLEPLDPQILGEVARALLPDVCARVLSHMTPDALAACLRTLGLDAAPILAQLPIAVAAPALRAQEPALSRELLQALPKTVSVPLGFALRYPAGTVGALLDPHAATVQRDMSVRETVQIARRAPQLLRRYVYVLDDRQQLVGVLDVCECLLAARSASVHTLMRPDPLFVRARASLAEAAADRAWLQLDVLPVVGRARSFLGVLRRRVLDAARAQEAAAGAGEAEVGGVVVDLANLYWQASTALLLGAPERRGRKP